MTKVLELMKLINSMMDAYFGDVKTSVWYKSHQIEIQVYRLLRNNVGVKVSVFDRGSAIYIAENDKCGTWSNQTWCVVQSKISKMLEDAIGVCK